MSNIKGEEGLDLEKWSISELQTLVNQFRAKIENEKVQSSSQTNIGQAKLENNYYNEDNKEEKEESLDKSNKITEKTEKKNINSQSSQSTQYSFIIKFY